MRKDLFIKRLIDEVETKHKLTIEQNDAAKKVQMQLLNNLSVMEMSFNMVKVEKVLLDVRINAQELSFGIDADQEQEYVRCLRGERVKRGQLYELQKEIKDDPLEVERNNRAFQPLWRQIEIEREEKLRALSLQILSADVYFAKKLQIEEVYHKKLKDIGINEFAPKPGVNLVDFKPKMSVLMPPKMTGKVRNKKN